MYIHNIKKYKTNTVISFKFSSSSCTLSSSMMSSLYKLGAAPSPEEVDQFILSYVGWKRSIIGNSVQGKDLYIYQYDCNNNNNNNINDSTKSSSSDWVYKDDVQEKYNDDNKKQLRRHLRIPLLSTKQQPSMIHNSGLGNKVNESFDENDPGGKNDIRRQRISDTVKNNHNNRQSSIKINNNNNSKTILFLSLEHGNEPMGLMSLLATVELISTSPSSSVCSLYQQQQQNNNDNNDIMIPIRIIVFPIVNIDAYMINRLHNGMIRTNFVHKYDGYDYYYDSNGNDLNRNYPNITEPESFAIHNVIHQYNVTHALSFHSMRHKDRPRCIIYPYSSGKVMSSDRVNVYRTWSSILNHEYNISNNNTNNNYDNRNIFHPYVTGTAIDTVQYMASGTSLDYFDEYYNIYSFSIEALPPCRDRWCTQYPKSVMKEAYLNGQTAYQFLQLAILIPNNSSNVDTVSSLSSLSLLLYNRTKIISFYSLTFHDNILVWFYNFCDDIKEYDYTISFHIYGIQWIVCLYFIFRFVYRVRNARSSNKHHRHKNKKEIKTIMINAIISKNNDIDDNNKMHVNRQQQ